MELLERCVIRNEVYHMYLLVAIVVDKRVLFLAVLLLYKKYGS